ncbi:MAG: hypothetical protein AAGI68_02975 [Planctomycetota bacterium]
MLRTLAALSVAVILATNLQAQAQPQASATPDHRTDPQTLHRAITAALDANQPAKAQVLLERWRQQDPRDATYLQLQAHVYNLLGAPAAAVETVTLALRDPDLPEKIRVNLQLIRAESLMLCGDFLPAYREYTRLFLGPHFRGEPRQELLGQLQAARRAHFDASVVPPAPPKLAYTNTPQDVPPDLAYLMLSNAEPRGRTARPSRALVDWAIAAAQAHPESQDLARFAVLRALRTGHRGVNELFELPGYQALPKLFHERVDRQRRGQAPPAFGEPGPNDAPDATRDLTAETAPAFLAELRQRLADSEPQAQRLIEQRDELLADIQAVHKTLDAIRVRNGLADVLARAEADYFDLRERVDAWHAAAQLLVEPFDRWELQRTLNRIQSKTLAAEAELSPVLQARQNRIQALRRDAERMPQPRLDQLAERWLERYRQVRPLIAIEEARAAEDWQAVMNHAEVWLSTRRSLPNRWVHHERYDAAMALGDELSATDAVLRITADDDPPSERWESWFATSRNQALRRMIEARKAIDAGRPVEAGRLLTDASLHLPAEPEVLRQRYRLAEMFGNARAKVEVLRDYHYLYEPLPIPENEAMNLALQAHDWAFLLALSEPLVGYDDEATFHHYAAAQALNLQGIVSRTWPLVRGSRFALVGDDIHQRFGKTIARGPLKLSAETRKQHQATLADPDKPLADRVYAASILHRDGTPKPVLPIRASDPLYLAQQAKTPAEVVAKLGPGQRIHVGGEAWIDVPPAGAAALTTLRVHGGSNDAMTRLHIDSTDDAFLDDKKQPSLRLVEVRNANLRFRATTKLTMGPDSALTVFRGGLDKLHRFAGHGLVQSSALVLYHTAPTAQLELDHTSWHLDLYGVPGTLAGHVTARHGMLMMRSPRVTVPAGARLDLHDMVVGWSFPNHDNTPRLLVRDGADFAARDTRFVNLGNNHILLPAGTPLPGCTTIGEDAPLTIGGQPTQAPTHRSIPNTFTGNTHTARNVGELFAAADKAKRGDTIELTANAYELPRTLELPDGVRLQSAKFGRTVDLAIVADPKQRRRILNVTGRAVRLEDIRFWIRPRREGGFTVAGLRDATNLGLVANDATVLMRNCGFFSHHSIVTHYGISAEGESLVLADKAMLHGPGRVGTGSSLVLNDAQVVNSEASVLGSGELRALMADELADPLTLSGKQLALRSGVLGMRFRDGGGDPLAKLRHARAVEARDEVWGQARTDLVREWDAAADVDARGEAVKRFHRRVLAADLSEDHTHHAAEDFAAKALNPLFLKRTNEAGRHFFNARLSPRLLMGNHFHRRVKDAVGQTATGWQAVGLQASQAEKDRAVAFFRTFPPGSKYHTLARKLLDEGKPFKEVQAQVTRRQALDQQRADAAIRAARQAQLRAQQQRQATQWQRFEPAPPPRRTWQDAYAAYRATRPPLISSRQMNFARQNELRTMRQQNWTMQRNGLRPMYDIPGW